MFEQKLMPIGNLTPNPKNVRTHSKKQIRQIADSIKAFGFPVPIIVDEEGMILAGHGRLDAARLLKLKEVPVVRLQGLTPARKRAFMLADNKIASNAGWDRKRLAAELAEVTELLKVEAIDIGITGFEPVELDMLAADFEEDTKDPADETVLSVDGPNVSRRGDIWLLGHHRLVCGNARLLEDVDALMASKEAAMVFADPPYNVKIAGVVGRGKTKHAEFAEASGEQSEAEFTSFLTETLRNAARVTRDGGVHFICMDWRHTGELIAAGKDVYPAHLNLAVWVKSNAGQGSFYRSQHELIHVFRVGRNQHQNNIELGRHGRSRSNVWHYAGVNGFRVGRMDDLQIHPTVKPVALVVDAIKDVTKRGDVVLDPFCGSGTTILAAERVGRVGYGLEIDPRYIDASIRRWQNVTRCDAICASTGETFEERCRQMSRPTAGVRRRAVRTDA